MIKFNQCPNCGKRPVSGFFNQAVSWTIYECKICGTKYCGEKCGSGCPNCGSKERKKVGTCSSG